MRRRTNIKKIRRRLTARGGNLGEALESVSDRQARKLASRARDVIDRAEGRYKKE
jgi:hypothetical protein